MLKSRTSLAIAAVAFVVVLCCFSSSDQDLTLADEQTQFSSGSTEVIREESSSLSHVAASAVSKAKRTMALWVKEATKAFSRADDRSKSLIESRDQAKKFSDSTKKAEQQAKAKAEEAMKALKLAQEKLSAVSGAHTAAAAEWKAREAEVMLAKQDKQKIAAVLKEAKDSMVTVQGEEYELDEISSSVVDSEEDSEAMKRSRNLLHPSTASLEEDEEEQETKKPEKKEKKHEEKKHEEKKHEEKKHEEKRHEERHEETSKDSDILHPTLLNDEEPRHSDEKRTREPEKKAPKSAIDSGSPMSSLMEKMKRSANMERSSKKQEAKKKKLEDQKAKLEKEADKEEVKVEHPKRRQEPEERETIAAHMARMLFEETQASVKKAAARPRREIIRTKAAAAEKPMDVGHLMHGLMHRGDEQADAKVDPDAAARKAVLEKLNKRAEKHKEAEAARLKKAAEKADDSEDSDYANEDDELHPTLLGADEVSHDDESSEKSIVKSPKETKKAAPPSGLGLLHHPSLLSDHHKASVSAEDQEQSLGHHGLPVAHHKHHMKAPHKEAEVNTHSIMGNLMAASSHQHSSHHKAHKKHRGSHKHHIKHHKKHYKHHIKHHKKHHTKVHRSTAHALDSNLMESSLRHSHHNSSHRHAVHHKKHVKKHHKKVEEAPKKEVYDDDEDQESDEVVSESEETEAPQKSEDVKESSEDVKESSEDGSSEDSGKGDDDEESEDTADSLLASIQAKPKPAEKEEAPKKEASSEPVADGYHEDDDAYSDYDEDSDDDFKF